MSEQPDYDGCHLACLQELHIFSFIYIDLFGEDKILSQINLLWIYYKKCRIIYLFY